MTAEFILDEWLVQWELWQGGLDLFAPLKLLNPAQNIVLSTQKSGDARLLYLYTKDQLL